MCLRGQILLEIHDAIATVTQNWVGEKFTMCSRGQILLEIHDAIALVTQNGVGKIHDVFTRYSQGLLLFPVV